MDTGTGGASESGSAPERPRPWLLVAVVAAVLLGTELIALVAYLAAGGHSSPQASASRAAARGSGVVARTDGYYKDTVRLDLGQGAEAVATQPNSDVDTALFVAGTGDGVEVQLLTLYNDRARDEQGTLHSMIGRHEGALLGCVVVQADEGTSPTLDTAMETTGTSAHSTYTCDPPGPEQARRNEVYGFATQRQVNELNTASTFVLVHVAGDDDAGVLATLRRALGTLEVSAPGSEAATGKSDVVGTTPDPGVARNEGPTTVWAGSDPFSFPAGWRLVGAGPEYSFVAPAESGLDAVRGYTSPGIVLARSDPKPGGHRDEASLRDALVQQYGEIASEHGCSERADLQPIHADGADVLWSGCTNGLVDRVVVYPDSGGVALLSVRASGADAAESLARELAG